MPCYFVPSSQHRNLPAHRKDLGPHYECRWRCQRLDAHPAVSGAVRVSLQTQSGVCVCIGSLRPATSLRFSCSRGPLCCPPHPSDHSAPTAIRRKGVGLPLCCSALLKGSAVCSVQVPGDAVPVPRILHCFPGCGLLQLHQVPGCPQGQRDLVKQEGGRLEERCERSGEAEAQDLLRGYRRRQGLSLSAAPRSMYIVTTRKYMHLLLHYLSLDL